MTADRPHTEPPQRHSRVYFGQVMHRRLRPVRHRFAYRVATFLFDIDELDGLDRDLALFSHNRPNLFAFHDRDHGPRDGTCLRTWAEAQLARAGVDIAGGRIAILCLPRLFGYVFNPLSVWFCHHRDGHLAAIIYDVRNTFGERHSYVRPVDPLPTRWIEQAADKQFYVSPFLPMNMRYAFRLRPPGDDLALLIREYGPDGMTLVATWTGQRRPLTVGTLAATALRFPLLTVKVIAAIHWQAFRLWRKGATYHPHTPTTGGTGHGPARRPATAGARRTTL